MPSETERLRFVGSFCQGFEILNKAYSVSKYILLTGATGMLGEYLVRNLLLQGHRLAVVVRHARKTTAEQRVEAMLQRWEAQVGHSLPRPVCLVGDVTQEHLGLDAPSRNWVAKHCDSVIHNAAALTFHTEPNGEPWRTNVEGTRNVLKLCENLKLRKLHYVSTAYVCGIRSDVVGEDELDAGQKFRNDYERSKFQSETLVREASFIHELTVYRPAVIVGDSQSGYMATYHGLGMYLRLMSLMIWALEPDENGVRHTPLHLPCTGEEPRNLVSVEWVAEVMSRLIDNPAAHGGTYHITPDERMTARQLIDYTGTYFNCQGVVYAAPQIGVNDFDAMAHEHLSIYHDYLMTDPHFDRTQMLKFVPDLPSPRIDEAMIHRYLQYGEEDRWGKRRQPLPEVPISVGDYLGRVASHDRAKHSLGNGTNGSQRQRFVGLDILGPGGGQWSICLHDNHPVSCEPGLPADNSPVIKMTSDEFAEIFSPGEDGSLQNLFRRVVSNKIDKSKPSIVRSVVQQFAADTFATNPQHGS